nr:MAG TPA: Protein of unknown function (DUF1284) [Caudoviricetes sp.]
MNNPQRYQARFEPLRGYSLEFKKRMEELLCNF